MNMRLLRQATRSLLRAPWYSATLIATLALGIALSSVAFAVVDAVLFRPLPYLRPSELYFPVGIRGALTVQEGRAWTAARPELQSVVYQPPFVLSAVGIGRVRVVSAAAVGEGFCEFLGVQPLLGGFTTEDFRAPPGPRPALISHALWLREFDGSRDVLGKHFDVPGAMDRNANPIGRFRITGVLPAEFLFPTIRNVPDILFPLAGTTEQESDPGWSAATILIRVPGRTSPEATAAYLTQFAREQKHLGVDSQGREVPVRLQPFSDVLVNPQQGAATTALSAAILLLALSFLGTFTLAVARGIEREDEVRLRLALGAGNRDLVKLAVAQAIPPVAIGAAAGALLAPLLLSVVLTIIPSTLVTLRPIAIGLRVAAFATAASIVGILLLAGAGALRRGTGRRRFVTVPQRSFGRSRTRALGVLVASQVALCFVLAVGGAKALEAWHRAWQGDVGFDLEHSFLVELDLTSLGQADQAVVMDAVSQRLSRLPGTDAVGSVDGWFLRPNNRSMSSGIVRPPGAMPGDEGLVSYSGDLFGALGIELRQVRFPSVADRANIQATVVVSEGAARALWPDGVAIGRTLVTSRGDALSVVGIVEDATYGSLTASSPGQVYLPTPEGRLRSQPSLIVGTQQRLDVATGAAGAAIRELGVRGEVMRVETVSAALGRSVQMQTFRAWTYGSFAFAALVITGVVVMGLTAMVVAHRKKEAALRYVLGATRASVVRTMMGPQLLAVGCGLVGGGVLAIRLSGLMGTLQSTWNAADIATWVVTALTVAITSLCGGLASVLPVRKVQPASILNGD